MRLIKKSLTLLYVIFMIASLLSACRGPEEKAASTSSAFLNPVTGEKYNIDTKESVVAYKGSMMLTSRGSHAGYVYLSKGELLMEKDQLAGGTVEVDMNTITDEKHGRDNGLVQHLKSADFFEVEKFPFSSFIITVAAQAKNDTVNITGILTIKGIAQTITFPAKVKVKDEVIHANGSLTIDRTKWDVRYKSGKFGLNLLADDIISDDIEFQMKIVAKK